MEQKGLHGVAGGGIVGLGVEDHWDGAGEVDSAIDVDVAHALGVAHDRDARVLLDVADEGVGAARDD